MKLLILFASLLIIATPHAHARTLQGIINSTGDKLDMIISVYGRTTPSPPPSPSKAPSKQHSARGNSGSCDHETTHTYNNDKIKCRRANDWIIGSPPPPPPAMALESSTCKEHYQVKPRSPPPPPKRAPPIRPGKMIRTPPALCMPGRPCGGTDRFIM
ncbi:CASP-like protein 4A2 isoform X1 [Morus notabilis]|uniref:CASP-like protein 4A2 isoform X1 n=1 Tax=Morus notabilis TaxID=981085 RepID=UPI000CECF113|nr:CASP-like protein 4A2 isoform X1 [Morus notabilis]